MVCHSGSHPEAEEDGQGEGEGPNVQEEEEGGPGSICHWGSPLPALWMLRGLFDRGGLRRVHQLPR